MKPVVRVRRVCASAIAASWLAAGGVAFAQGAAPPAVAQGAPPPAGEQVSGAQLQQWLDRGFGFAGAVIRPHRCMLLNVAQGRDRVLFVRCPNGWAERLVGTIRVVGDSFCASFPIPNGPPGEDCVTWHSLGQWRFEQRKDGEPVVSVIVLPEGLIGDR